MSKLTRLIREGREAAEWRGHRLPARFTHDSKTTAYAYCQTGCGSGVFVNTNPAPNGIDIHGEAVAINCPNADVDKEGRP